MEKRISITFYITGDVVNAPLLRPLTFEVAVEGVKRLRQSHLYYLHLEFGVFEGEVALTLRFTIIHKENNYLRNFQQLFYIRK